MTVTDPKPLAAATKPKSSKRGKSATGTPQPPQPSDTFSQQTQQAQERHLRMEHLAQMQAQEQLHKARIQAMFTQLHTQLFTLWNDIWMQRRKAHDDAFKAWLKLLVA